MATKPVTAKLRPRLELIAALPEPILLDRLRRLSVAELILFRRLYGIRECRCKGPCNVQQLMLRVTRSEAVGHYLLAPRLSHRVMWFSKAWGRWLIEPISGAIGGECRTVQHEPSGSDLREPTMLDLKDMLKRMLASEGKKRFFFAYGLGKRKDKHGEGELVVRGQKPKKSEVEAKLTDAGDFYEGICWLGIGPENSETVYFQSKGKKLSTSIITKMTKTAKNTAKANYDFQMPTPEEEARAETLTEGGEESAESVSISPGVDFA